METKDLIQLKPFCEIHQVGVSLLTTLHEFSLIKIIYLNTEAYIDPAELPKLEKLIRLHVELNINPEGLDAVFHLLEKMQAMQHEIRALQEKLKIYE
ncbi:MerR family transcriptional regulator [Flavobacterium album]|uniref:MerR family transcriptional regulator n=1 Tax=Flavobacterium album TaxID=2175091 RepID=A0A2S1R1A2_9FLAO|nr:chaperone modulator CbpM [Flavobacterium album]AWH86392.1 MerR family transcriptional regulator [Flavobacterium album]